MSRLLQLMFLVTTGCCSVYSQGLPYQVNNPRVESCATQISLDTGTLTGITRGDEGSPCTGYVLYTNGPGQTERMCSSITNDLTDYEAQRACYTMGVNFFRDSRTFSADTTRQMMLYRCFEYEEANVESAEEGEGNAAFVQPGSALSGSLEQGCTDEGADPSVFDCFDTCYNTNGDPTLGVGDACAGDYPYFAIGCVDINECVNGVRDYCTGPFESSCTIRKACGNNTDCTNHAGSFECTCKDGYDANSFDPYVLDAGCKDVDECELSKCDTNAKCINTMGSYLCLCEPGYAGDGHTCTELPCNPLPDVPNCECTGSYYSYVNYVFGDTAECKCSDGYKVSVRNIPMSLVKDYGYENHGSFTLTCDANGAWGPLPVPECLPVSCGDPGIVNNANRMGSGFLYMQRMTYQCQKGYRAYNPRLGASSFVRTCQEDGTWTEGTVCVDVDECEDTPEVCEDRHYCFNTGGSYICVPYFPKTCDGLDLCQNGKCKINKNKAECICDEGYTGIMCETPVIGLGVILAIVAIVLGGLLLLLFSFCIFCFATHRPQVAPQVAPQPTYGRHWPPLKFYGFRRSPINSNFIG